MPDSSEPQNKTVAVTAAEDDLIPLARQLALECALPYTDAVSGDYRFLLTRNSTRLELQWKEREAPGPLAIDFAGGVVDYRRRHGGGRKQMLARAVGLKNNRCPTVVDATAGLGRDAFVLASLGCRVWMLERSLVIALLLHDGLKRARANPETQKIAHRMHLLVADSLTLDRVFSKSYTPEVIYLDPMYPHRKKSALVKKEMRYLRELAGDDPDADQLLAVSLSMAGDRVVVKRPKSDPPLSGPEPTLVVRSSKHRYDIYRISRE